MTDRSVTSWQTQGTGDGWSDYIETEDTDHGRDGERNDLVDALQNEMVSVKGDRLWSQALTGLETSQRQSLRTKVW